MFSSIIKCEQGVTLIEYAAVAALIALVALTGIKDVGKTAVGHGLGPSARAAYEANGGTCIPAISGGERDGTSVHKVSCGGFIYEE